MAVSPMNGRSPGPGELLQMATVASRYYLDGRSKVEIADELGLSRFKVARLLASAHDLGIVEVRLRIPDGINHPVSTRLRDAYGLHQAIVVDWPDHPADELRGHLGRVAADLLSEVVQENDVLGVAWGRTVNATIAKLQDLKKCSIVQLTGAMSEAQVDDNAIELVRRMSELARGPAYPIYAPLLLDDADAAHALRTQARVAEALSRYDEVTIALVPIGSWNPPFSQLYDVLTPAEREELISADVRADTSTVLLTGEGEIYTPALSRRMIGVSGEQLLRIPEKIAVAGGVEKAEAIRVAIRAGMVTTLVTNRTVADRLLASAEAQDRPMV